MTDDGDASGCRGMRSGTQDAGSVDVTTVLMPASACALEGSGVQAPYRRKPGHGRSDPCHHAHSSTTIRVDLPQAPLPYILTCWPAKPPAAAASPPPPRRTSAASAWPCRTAPAQRRCTVRLSCLHHLSLSSSVMEGGNAQVNNTRGQCAFPVGTRANRGWIAPRPLQSASNSLCPQDRQLTTTPLDSALL